MEKIRNISVMQQTSRSLIQRDRTIGFVPTMGALHEGHLSLVRRSKEENDVTVVSIFVNPVQFGPSEDFSRYPRDIEGDMEKLHMLEVDVLFLPDIKDIYPEGYSTYVTVEGLSGRLCGHFRPGHFTGVSTVVAKLLNIVRPVRVYFGQKDYQQSLIIRRLVRDLNFDAGVVVCPTVRDSDGLALSSRNEYLTEDERRAAAVINKTLIEAERGILSGASLPEVRLMMEKSLERAPLIREVQYASIFDPETLDDVSSGDVNIDKGQVLLAAAVIIGAARLIDNRLVKI